MEIKKELWAVAPTGQEIYKYTITNSKGASVVLSSYGAGIVSINVPDKNGVIGDVVLGYKKAEDYYGDGPFSGKVPGRFANRIAKGKFSLDGKEYTLNINNGENHLHGGPTGFAERVWDSRIDGFAVEFMYFSEDGEEGYPGNLKVVTRYEWSEDNELTMTFTGECDAPTVINLVNHVYFNLEGEGAGNIFDHMLKLNSSNFLPTDAGLIPLGPTAPVAGTPLDFRAGRRIGDDILNFDYEPLKIGKGYDHCFCIDGAQPGQLQKAATLWSEKTGRQLDITTTQPAIQIYTGNYVGGSPEGKCGRSYNDYEGVAMETQHYPDSPNEPAYPSTELRPGQVYQEATIYAFTTK